MMTSRVMMSTIIIIYQQLILFALLFFLSSPSYIICAFISVPLPVSLSHYQPKQKRAPPDYRYGYHPYPTISTSTSIQGGVLLNARPPFSIDNITDDRYIDIRTALNRMNILQTKQQHPQNDEAQVEAQALMKDFQKRIQKVVVCRESSIKGAGQGLFATKNIQVGTIIGFYPVHGIGVDFNNDDDDNDDDTSICLGITPEDQDYFDTSTTNNNEKEMTKKKETTSESNYIQYLIGSRRLGTSDFGPDAQLFIDINPHRNRILEKNHHDSDTDNRSIDNNSSSCWISHYINDGATVLENSERGLLEYYSETNRHKNCVHIPFGPAPILATVTTKKVKKGEELFTSYGCLYWAAENENENDDDGESNSSSSSIVDTSSIIITDAVQLQAKQTAQDIFMAWKNSQLIHTGKQRQLQECFDKI